MNWLVPRLFGQAADWRDLSYGLFDGQGSYGNGGAMRAAPIGAYFAADTAAAAQNALLAAEVTHAHPEAIAGAIAVAVAASIAASLRGGKPPAHGEILKTVASFIAVSEVKRRILVASDLPKTTSVIAAVCELGNGSQVTAVDTVPFALWCATQALESFEEAMWLTVSGMGDRDTTCAIAGGIAAAYCGTEGIPAEWRARSESLPRWVRNEQMEW
jgi:ADP-ribosylglycohydrolase